jgi:hypothetical protein
MLLLDAHTKKGRKGRGYWKDFQVRLPAVRLDFYPPGTEYIPREQRIIELLSKSWRFAFTGLLVA